MPPRPVRYVPPSLPPSYVLAGPLPVPSSAFVRSLPVSIVVLAGDEVVIKSGNGRHSVQDKSQNDDDLPRRRAASPALPRTHVFKFGSEQC